MNTEKEITIGRQDRPHLKIVKVQEDAVIADVIKDDILKARCWIGPDGEDDIQLNRMEGYCRIGDPIDPRAVVFKLMTRARYDRLVIKA